MSQTGVPTPPPPAVPAHLLPSASSPHLIVVAATSLEYDQTTALNSNEWVGPLTIPQYFDRERHLADQTLTRDGQITGWILTSTDLPPNPDGTRPILASCETLLKHAYTALNGKVSKILAHGIASVYTRPEHRGRGYAGRMMAELGPRLDTWQQPSGTKGIFSVVYSDIGNKFYAKYGWQAYPSTHILLAPITKASYAEAHTRLDLPEISGLNSTDLVSLNTISHLESELVAQSTRNPNLTHIAIRSDIEHFEWHFGREEIQCRFLNLPFPTVKGAVHTLTGAALIWTRVFSDKPENWQLVVLRTILPNHTVPISEVEKALATLLLRAQLEADAAQMQAGVEVWNPEPVVVRAAQSLRKEEEGLVEVESREKEHVCSLRWAEDVEKEVVWVGNEKYGWC